MTKTLLIVLGLLVAIVLISGINKSLLNSFKTTVVSKVNPTATPTPDPTDPHTYWIKAKWNQEDPELTAYCKRYDNIIERCNNNIDNMRNREIKEFTEMLEIAKQKDSIYWQININETLARVYYFKFKRKTNWDESIKQMTKVELEERARLKSELRERSKNNLYLIKKGEKFQEEAWNLWFDDNSYKFDPDLKYSKMKYNATDVMRTKKWEETKNAQEVLNFFIARVELFIEENILSINI